MKFKSRTSVKGKSVHNHIDSLLNLKKQNKIKRNVKRYKTNERLKGKINQI